MFIFSDEVWVLFDGDIDFNDVDIVDFIVFLEGLWVEVIWVVVEEEVVVVDLNLEDFFDEFVMYVNVFFLLVLFLCLMCI